MKISEVKKELLSKALISFKLLGFSKKGSLIVKSSQYFEIYLAFGVVDNDNSFPTTFHFGISSIVLNNLLFKIFPEKGYKKNQFSGVYGQKQTLLFDKKEYPILEYDIKNTSDIDKMIADILDYFQRKIIKKLERLQNVQELSILLNSQEVIAESMHLTTTAINALIFCKLSDNINYNLVKSKYRELLKDWSDWDKQELEKVISFLDNHSQEELLKISETT